HSGRPKSHQQAQTLKMLNEELASVEDLAPASAGVIDGVRVIWITQGQSAARDETAFRHALAIGHRLKSQGEPLKDNKLIDAYDRDYNITTTVGDDQHIHTPHSHTTTLHPHRRNSNNH